MLKDSKAVGTLATSDMDRARAFYSGTLGFPMMADLEFNLVYQLPDGSAFQVYYRPNHEAPANTSQTFLVDDIDQEMADLRGKGVVFADYDIPEIEMKTENGVFVDPTGGKAAWFNDPDGNILSLAQLPPGQG